MSKFRQYQTSHTRAGWKQCTLCGDVIPSLRSCKCSVKIRLSGNQEEIDKLLDVLESVIQYQIPDNEYCEDQRTYETYITIYATTPETEPPQ